MVNIDLRHIAEWLIIVMWIDLSAQEFTMKKFEPIHIYSDTAKIQKIPNGIKYEAHN